MWFGTVGATVRALAAGRWRRREQIALQVSDGGPDAMSLIGHRVSGGVGCTSPVYSGIPLSICNVKRSFWRWEGGERITPSVSLVG